MNNVALPDGSWNWLVPLATIQVGSPTPPVAPGTVTDGSDLKILPLLSISSENPVPSSLIQKGSPGKNALPHYSARLIGRDPAMTRIVVLGLKQVLLQ
jgi:hypothetical protein